MSPPLNALVTNEHLLQQLALHDRQIHEMQVHLMFLTTSIGGIPGMAMNRIHTSGTAVPNKEPTGLQPPNN